MAYEHEYLTGRRPADPQHIDHENRPSDARPWLIVAGVVVALLALIWVMGGATGGDPAPAGNPGALPGTEAPGAIAPAPEPAPMAPAPID